MEATAGQNRTRVNGLVEQPAFSTSDKFLVQIANALIDRGKFRSVLKREGGNTFLNWPPCSWAQYRLRTSNSEKVVWWAHQDSNLEPRRYEHPALTIEL